MQVNLPARFVVGGTGFEQGRMQNCLSFCMGLLSFPDQQRRCIDLQKEFSRLYQPGKKTETRKLLRHGASKMLNNRNKWEQGAGLGKRVSTQKGGVMRKKKRADRGEAQGGVGNAEKKTEKSSAQKYLIKTQKSFKKAQKQNQKRRGDKEQRRQTQQTKTSQKSKRGENMVKKIEIARETEKLL